MILYSLTGYSQPGVTGGCQGLPGPPSLSTHRSVSKYDWLDWIPSDCPTDRYACGYLWIYNSIIPRTFRLSFRFSFRLSTNVTCFRCSLVNTSGTSCREIPNWRAFQRSIRNNRSKTLTENQTCWSTKEHKFGLLVL